MGIDRRQFIRSAAGAALISPLFGSASQLLSAASHFAGASPGATGAAPSSAYIVIHGTWVIQTPKNAATRTITLLYPKDPSGLHRCSIDDWNARRPLPTGVKEFDVSVTGAQNAATVPSNLVDGSLGTVVSDKNCKQKLDPGKAEYHVRVPFPNHVFGFRKAPSTSVTPGPTSGATVKSPLSMGYIFVYDGNSATPPQISVGQNGSWSGSELHVRAEPDKIPTGPHPAFELIRQLYYPPLDVTVTDTPVCPEPKAVATIPCTHLLSWPEHLAHPDDCGCQTGNHKSGPEKNLYVFHVSTSNCMGIVHDGP
jgi:hypothetical protein